MNNSSPIRDLIGSTDIYLLDQIMKGRYKREDIILDAGCGYGRNLHWFLNNNMDIYGIDQDIDAVKELQSQHPAAADRFRHSPVEQLPFDSDQFDHIISSAVLHFATDTAHFHQMIAEMTRVLRPEGSLFIRMISVSKTASGRSAEAFTRSPTDHTVSSSPENYSTTSSKKTGSASSNP